MVGDFDSDSGGACGTPKQIWVGLLAGAAKAPDVRRHDAKPEGVAISQSVIGGPEAAAIRLKCQRPAAKRSEGANRAADEEPFCAQSNAVPESAAAASFAAASRSVIDDAPAGVERRRQ